MRWRVLAVAALLGLVLGPVSAGSAAGSASGSAARSASVTAAAVTPGVAAEDDAPPAADQIAPLVVVLDLSGSMNDDDGAGVIKLSGAKKAVDGTIRDLASNQPFGVWTYPGGTASCSPGEFVIAPGPVADKTGAIATVDGLTADGGTPTGPALEAVAAALKAQGTNAATLVLVSDGESNCGHSPCAVAADLLDQGFAVTVHAVGFRVSEGGRAELGCVASTTGGTYVDADDSEQLNEQLRELTRAKLRVQTASALFNPTSGTARLTVTVTNISNVTANDVRVLLTWDGADPAGLNPLLRVGNIPPAAIVQRTWVVGVDPITSAPSLRVASDQPFELSSWANNADRVSVTGTVRAALADSGVDGSMRHYLGDWLREPLEQGQPIVIMGDSYSSGEGTFDYVTTSSGVSAGCHRSAKTYLIPQLEPGDVINIACSGAVAWDFSGTGREGTPPQLDQLEAIDQAPSAVVMTLGGNDIGFEEIIEHCVKGRCDSDARLVETRLRVADWLRAWLKPTYEDVWITLNTAERVAQRGGKTAPVIVLAYPQVTHATRFGACGVVRASGGIKGTFGSGEVAVANRLAARLNAAIKAAVADANADGYEVYFVADVADVAQPNHTLCDAEPYINDIVGFGKSESVHPNVAGYAAISGLVITWTESTDRTPTSRTSGRMDERKGDRERWRLLPSRPSTFTPSSSGTVISGDSLILKGSGFEPGSPVNFTIHSTPAVLATAVAGEDGEVQAEVRIPATLELGAHEIFLYGQGEDGAYREERIPVAVLAAPPWWVELGLPAAGLLVAAAAVFALLSWRSRRRAGRGRPGALGGNAVGETLVPPSS